MPLVEFVYNNSYHSSIGMTPFEALYGQPCQSLLCWVKVGNGKLLGPKMIQETNEKIVIVREKTKAAQDKHKSYVD